MSTASRWSTSTAWNTLTSLTPRTRNIKAPWNHIHNIPRVYTPADTAVRVTQFGYALLVAWPGPARGADRAHGAADRKESLFSVQLIDAYTFNFDYIGSRTTGNDGGSFLVAGPGWKGETPKGVKKVIRSETELALWSYIARSSSTRPTSTM